MHSCMENEECKLVMGRLARPEKAGLQPGPVSHLAEWTPGPATQLPRLEEEAKTKYEEKQSQRCTAAHGELR